MVKIVNRTLHMLIMSFSFDYNNQIKPLYTYMFILTANIQHQVSFHITKMATINKIRLSIFMHQNKLRLVRQISTVKFFNVKISIYMRSNITSQGKKKADFTQTQT
jgi:hypothetical protein